MTGKAFVLHERLAADTAPVCDLPLCTVRLMDDATCPWLVLVPRRADIKEIVDLEAFERAMLMEEIAHASGVLRVLHRPDKINVGAIGNLVAQLHVHVVARFRADPLWPRPVWGHDAPRPHGDEALASSAARLADAFGRTTL